MSEKYKVTFVDKSDDVKKTLEGLSKTALRESGKVIRKKMRENVPLRTKHFKNHIGTWVRIDKSTGQPKMDVGFYSWQKVKKIKKQPSHANPHWVEFGTHPHKISVKNAKALSDSVTLYGKEVQHPGSRPTNVLRDTVYDNVAEIRAAQEKYLSEISKTLEEAKRKIDSGEEFEDND